SKDSFYATLTVDNGLRINPWGGGGGGAPNFHTVTDLVAKTLNLKETHVFSPNVVNIATVGYAGTYADSMNSPAVPMSKDVVFLEGGNPGPLVIGGGISAASASAIAGIPGNNPYWGVRNYFQYSDDLRIIKGKHSWSIGGWFVKIQQDLSGVALSSAAAVGYPTIPAFLRDQPSNAILTRNAPTLGFRSTEAAWYVQDDMKLRSNFTLRVGLRHEMTNGWNEVVGRCSNYRFDPGFVIQTNPTVGKSCIEENHAKLLLQPRVGLAWDPTGTGSWAVRAAFGIHNDLIDNLGIRTQAGMPPYAARETLPYQNGFLPLLPLKKDAPLPVTCGMPGALALPLCGFYQPTGFDPNMRTPTVQIWDLTVDRQLAKDLVFSVGYVGSQSYHTNLTLNSNQNPPVVCQNPEGCRSGGVLTLPTDPNLLATRYTVPQGTLYMAPGPRPNPNVNYTQSWFGYGTASYHAMNVSLLKRAARGLSFKANYSWGKVLDLNSAILAPSGENEPTNLVSGLYNRSLNKGVAAYSLEHQFNSNFSYQLPFGAGQRFGSGASGWLNRLIGGWQWNGIATAQTGFPITPLIGFNNSGTGEGTQPTDVADRNPNFKGPVILGTPEHWFDARAFSMPTAGTFGNAGRSSLRGPNLFNVDTSLFKRIPI